MKFVMTAARAVLSPILLTLNALTAPKPMARDAEIQKQVDAETAALSLYEFAACPFCIKVRREMRRLNLKIERRDVGKSKAFEGELLQGGGEYQVPCLRILKDDGSYQWMYESDDIVKYLRERFYKV